uniref:Uncharacterized protein n=1 Tax=Anguilla anguilla TaxID=7936 RepID=A0A0E9TQX8_ANGAN
MEALYYIYYGKPHVMCRYFRKMKI